MARSRRWGGPRPAPYNPNARDADNDGMVQEGTVWERPGGTKFVNAVGREIAAAVSAATQGSYIADADGNRVDYTPTWQRGGDAPGDAGKLPRIGDIGYPSIGETHGTISDVVGTLNEPPKVFEPDVRDVIDPNIPDIPAKRDLEPFEVSAKVSELREYLDEKYPGVTSFIGRKTGSDSEGNPMVELAQLVVDEDARDTGVGTAFMEDLVAWADARGTTVTVAPSSDFGGNRARLDEFYGRFGFIPNRGRDKDYAITETMYRLPEADGAQLVPEKMGVVDRVTSYSGYFFRDKDGNISFTTRETKDKLTEARQAAFKAASLDGDDRAVEIYTRSRGAQINNYLRTGEGDLDEESLAAIDSIVKVFDAAEGIDERYTSYRGVDASSLVGDLGGESYDEAIEALIGKTISDGAFMSTSLSADDAIEFAKKQKVGEGAGKKSPPVVMRIDTPEGTKNLYLQGQTRFNEEEVLLPGGTKLRVVDATVIREQGSPHSDTPLYVLDVEVVPESESEIAGTDMVDRVLESLTPVKPDYGDYGPFKDNRDYNAQYAAASEERRVELLADVAAQGERHSAAMGEYREAQELEEAAATQIELGEPRVTPPRTTMTSTDQDLEVKSAKVKSGVKVEDNMGAFKLDLSKKGIDKRVDSLATQIGDDFGVEVDEVVYALEWDEWHKLDLTAEHAGALAFYQDGKVYISPSVARDLGSDDPQTYLYGIRVLSHEMGHAASGAVKNDLTNSGLRPVIEEAGAEISSISHAERRLGQELVDASISSMPGLDGPIEYNGIKSVYLTAGYPDRVEEMILQGVRRNGWNREAVLDDIMYTFTEGDPMELVYDEDGNATRIFEQNIGGRGAEVDPVAKVRWMQIWDQAPVDIMEPYRDVDPSGAYSADTPVIGEEHLTEAQWVERQTRVAALLYWLLEKEQL